MVRTINTCELPATAHRGLRKYYGKAKKMLLNEKKMEKFLDRLATKLSKIPKCGKRLANAPIFAAMLNSYFHKSYTQAPMGTILALLAALIYFVSPIDFVPDVYPLIGYLDDAAVLTACLGLVQSDIDEYQEWRRMNSNV